MIEKTIEAGSENSLERRRRAELRAEPLAIEPLHRLRPGMRERLAAAWSSGELSRRLLLATPLAAVAFAILAFGGVYGWAYGIAYLLIYGALAAWAILCFRGRLQLVGRPIYLPIVVFGIFAAASYGLHWTLVPGSTLTAMLHLAPAGAAFFLVTQLFRPDRDRTWLPMCLAVFTGALAFLAIVQIFTASGAIYWHFRYTYASPAGPYVNRNHFAGCMELLVPLATLEALRRSRSGWMGMAIWAAAPALGVAAVVLAASRGGALALMSQCLLALVFAIRAWRRSRRSGRRRAPAGLLAGAMIVLLCLTAIAVVGSDRLQARLAPANLTVDTNVQARNLLNRSSLAMWRAHPWAGWGLGTWGDVYPAFARFDDFRVYEFAHNDYLQLLAETGLIGVGLVGLFGAIWIHDLLPRLRAAPVTGSQADGEGAVTGYRGAEFAAAAAIACLGLLVHSWVDFNLHIPANLLLFFIVAGLGVA